MALQRESKMYVGGNRVVIYIPNSVYNDSQFPLTSTIVNVKIEVNRLVIEEVI